MSSPAPVKRALREARSLVVDACADVTLYNDAKEIRGNPHLSGRLQDAQRVERWIDRAEPFADAPEILRDLVALIRRCNEGNDTPHESTGDELQTIVSTRAYRRAAKLFPVTR